MQYKGTKKRKEKKKKNLNDNEHKRLNCRMLILN